MFFSRRCAMLTLHFLSLVTLDGTRLLSAEYYHSIITKQDRSRLRRVSLLVKI